MAMSRRERRLQRKLIPLNIAVCIISLIAVFSLFFMPIVKVDVGKILKDKTVMSFVDKSMEDMLQNSGESTAGIDVAPITGAIVKNVLGAAEGEVSVTAYSSFQVATATGENKSLKVFDELFFADNSLVSKMIDSIVDGVVGIFDSDEGRAFMEQTIVGTIAKELANNIDGVSEGDIKELTEKFKDIEKIQDGNVAPVVNDFADTLQRIIGSDISAEDRENISNTVQDMYDQTKDALDEGETVTIESMICVFVSQNVDLSQINIADILAGMTGGGNDNGGMQTAAYVSTADLSEDEGNENRIIVKDYSQLLGEIGLGAQEKEQIKTDLKATLREQIDGGVANQENIDQISSYYGYVFYGMLVAIVPWLLLFLSSFVHLLRRNKRFTMWYVKILGLLPVIVFAAVVLLPTLLPTIAPDMMTGENGALVSAFLSGVSTMTWISAACYILLWIISLFWAFPIKRKIRKERKAFKYGSRYGEDY